MILSLNKEIDMKIKNIIIPDDIYSYKKEQFEKNSRIQYQKN